MGIFVWKKAWLHSKTVCWLSNLLMKRRFCKFSGLFIRLLHRLFILLTSRIFSLNGHLRNLFFIKNQSIIVLLSSLFIKSALLPRIPFFLWGYIFIYKISNKCWQDWKGLFGLMKRYLNDLLVTFSENFFLIETFVVPTEKRFRRKTFKVSS